MMDVSDYHIATKKIHELREQLRATEDLCQSFVKRIQDAMHWLPMTPDAVFEDGATYIVCDTGRFKQTAVYNDFEKEFYCPAFNDDWIGRESITHYALITEPK